ncbi:MAG TPA: Wzy polymerase domain-containing protein [Rubrivivax sp.]|nr:Wzy polymerase domain-containing protein [Rubrivivax sp.]
MTPLLTPLLVAAALAAASGPSLLAFNVSPSPTFLNQALALALWGIFVALAAMLADGAQALRGALRDAALPLAALALLVLSVLWSWGPGALPSGLALSAIGLLLATLLLLLSGAATRASAQAVPVFALFCMGWVVAGGLNAAIGAVQVFAPGWTDGDWIARSGLPGRAVGNLRQPNHLSSLLLWSAIAVVPLLELGRIRRAVGAALFALMVFAVVLTASRTGLLGVGMLALWGLIDRRLSRPTRALLLLSPLLYGLAWLGLAAWAEAAQHTFGGEARLAEADLSGSRFGIWANSLSLIRQQPWSGVGFGEFNLAWTLTPFAERPTAFFDHTHNLPLQLAVELGLPLAAAVMALLLAGLWRAWRLSLAADADTGVTLRSAWVMLLLMALHSQLEYPLWYAYFLLPAAWLCGYGLGNPRRAAGASAEPVQTGAAPTRALFVGGMLLVIGSALALVDYVRVALIFAPPQDGTPLSERIADGRRSALFAHHADYAAVTTRDDLPVSGEAFKQAPHYLLDTRLMIAWARALARAGELDKARHLAQRLREFRNPLADEFFAACEAPREDAPAAFQCEAPERVPAWREYLD